MLISAGPGRKPRLALGVLFVSAALALGACGGDDDDDKSSKPKVGDCTNQPADSLTGLEGDYKVVDCGSSDAKSKITSDATGKGVAGCSGGGFFDVKEGEYCVGPK